MKPFVFAIILAGNGVYDGSEIHEAVMSMYAVQKNGAQYVIFAPDINQHHVINHVTGEEMPEKRNVLIESARIARGNIKDLKEFNAENFDALLIPGGFGVAKNLCSFAFDGEAKQINEQVLQAIQHMHKLHKPIGALCISPVLLAKAINGAAITLGNDKATIEKVEKMGATHQVSVHGQVTIDKKNKLFTAPCYMLEATIPQIAEDADNVVKEIINLLKNC